MSAARTPPHSSGHKERPLQITHHSALSFLPTLGHRAQRASCRSCVSCAQIPQSMPACPPTIPLSHISHPPSPHHGVRHQNTLVAPKTRSIARPSQARTHTAHTHTPFLRDGTWDCSSHIAAVKEAIHHAGSLLFMVMIARVDLLRAVVCAPQAHAVEHVSAGGTPIVAVRYIVHSMVCPEQPSAHSPVPVFSESRRPLHCCCQLDLMAPLAPIALAARVRARKGAENAVDVGR